VNAGFFYAESRSSKKRGSCNSAVRLGLAEIIALQNFAAGQPHDLGFFCGFNTFGNNFGRQALGDENSALHHHQRLSIGRGEAGE